VGFVVGCPLDFWNLEDFKAINDTLGKFLHVESKVLFWTGP
jgi:hypothetical protein